MKPSYLLNHYISIYLYMQRIKFQNLRRFESPLFSHIGRIYLGGSHMRMTQLSTEHQTSSNKLPKPTKEHLQNELHFHLAEKVLVKLREKELISQEEFNQISKLNCQKYNPLLGPLMCDNPWYNSGLTLICHIQEKGVGG